MNHQHISVAILAALEGGRAIMEVYSTDFAVDHKEDKSPLTEADRKAHTAIMTHLEPLGLPILSEEGRDIPYEERKGWNSFWLVDPLDGTKEFVKRNGEFTVNIALVEAGDPIVGVIYVPVLDILYVGVRDMGAVKVERFSAANCTDLDALFALGERLPIDSSRTMFTVVGSRSHLSEKTLAFVDALRKQHGEVEMVEMGSSLKLCLVAEGVADVYPRFAPTMEWDTAAGQGIAMAAGCTVTEQDGITPLRYNKENLLNPWFIVRR
jgi:3'(2'), 5'-bisphosphate nucleotidase